MSNVIYNIRDRVACVKCKQRHKPPVGISCTCLKAGTAVNLASSIAGNGQITGLFTITGQSSEKQFSQAEAMEKLNSIMDKFSDIEKRLVQQEKRGDSSLSAFSHPTAHSSPKSKVIHSHGHTTLLII